MPGKQARALCPVCQEPMPPDETECANCGAFVIDEAVVRLSRAFGIDREKALALFERGFRNPKQLADRDVDDVLRKGENGLLFLCTNCGGFVATGDASCPRCGAEFEPEEPAPPRPERDILDMILCPVCGADNDPSRDECEICGEDFRPRGEVGPEPPAVPDKVADLQKVDAILEDLELPPPDETRPAKAHVPRLSKVPKVTRPRPAPSIPSVAPRPRAVAASHKATPPRRRAAHTVPRAASVSPRPKTAAPKPSRRPERGRRRFTVSPEPAAALVAASAVGLFVTNALGQSAVAWGLLGVLLAAAAASVAFGVPRRDSGLEAVDGLLLAAAVLPGLLALAWTGIVAAGLAVAGGIPMALALRRGGKGNGRVAIPAACAVALAGYALASGLGWSAAATKGWMLGLANYGLWPAALVVLELRRRRFAVALRRELVRAERDVARQDYDESLKDYDRAIALGHRGAPGEDMPWYGKGATLILLGRYEDALRAIDTALDINPRNEVAWLNKGNALAKLGRHADALRCFDAALKVNPAYEVAWNNKGNALARTGDLEAALACYEKALALDPQYRGSWVNKGYVLTRLGRYEEAAACADRAMRIARARLPAA